MNAQFYEDERPPQYAENHIIRNPYIEIPLLRIVHFIDHGRPIQHTEK